jgi:FtsP/CotA-like multicopper oxidase with cupredoxin domain
VSAGLALIGTLAACRDSTGPAVDPLVGADPWLDPQPALLEDLDPDPLVFEGALVASPETWAYAPGATIEGLAYGGAVPGPLIRVPLGARVLVHFRNELPDGFDTTVHWHGIEANNDADGTPVTQRGVMPGDSFDYDFTVTRPGLFWYHPHARGAQGVFDGLYAPLLVEDPDEGDLVDQGVLPADERVLVLSDVSEYQGAPISVEVDNAMENMNGTEGEHLLVNGREDPVFEVAAGGAVRLRVVNTSITRFWRLSVPGHVLYRVGGEGGLLDVVRVEGGTVEGRVTSLADGADLGTTDVDLGYDRGQIVLAPAERADLVLVPEGEPGDELELRWEDFARGRHGMWMEGDEMVMDDAPDDGLRPGEAVATFRLTDGEATPWALSEGDPVLGAVGRSVGRLDGAGALDWSGEDAMVLSEFMDMFEDDQGVWQMTTELYMDGVSWHPDHMAGPAQPEAPTVRRARVGDTVTWEVRNESGMAHPLHLHGFSYQELSFVRTDEEAGTVTTWEAGRDEFEDTSLLPGETSLFLRFRADDPVGDGGAVGRWMRHCHILQHGENGMMSELVIEP